MMPRLSGGFLAFKGALQRPPSPNGGAMFVADPIRLTFEAATDQSRIVWSAPR